MLILNFQYFEILTVNGVKSVKLHHLAKFRGDRSNPLLRYGDFSIFRFFQYGSYPPSWICYARALSTTKRIWWSLLLCKIWLESMQ